MNHQPEAESNACGVYIHVPFCVKKCGYCDFYSVTDRDVIPAYVGSVVEEIKLVTDAPALVDTLYFGGGTPSLLTPLEVQRLLDEVRERFDVADAAEITLEVNPGTTSYEALSGYRQAGVNRLNIGVQSFDEKALAFLTRIHSSAQAIQCIEDGYSAGFDNIGLDLIYGLPGQTKKQWITDLQAATAHHPAHLSCYMLTYEPGTRLTLDLKNRCFKALSEKSVSNLYDVTVEYLSANGLHQYEVSNFSTGRKTRSQHNQKYWVHAPYLGLGPAAHSFTDNRRKWNIRSLAGYLERVRSHQSPVEGAEALDSHQLIMEAVYLGLRCVDGISIPRFENRFQTGFKALFEPALSACAKDGFLEIKSDRCRLTRRGLRFSDSIAARLIHRI